MAACVLLLRQWHSGGAMAEMLKDSVKCEQRRVRALVSFFVPGCFQTSPHHPAALCKSKHGAPPVFDQRCYTDPFNIDG